MKLERLIPILMNLELVIQTGGNIILSDLEGLDLGDDVLVSFLRPLGKRVKGANGFEFGHKLGLFLWIVCSIEHHVDELEQGNRHRRIVVLEPIDQGLVIFGLASFCIS